MSINIPTPRLLFSLPFAFLFRTEFMEYCQFFTSAEVPFYDRAFFSGREEVFAGFGRDGGCNGQSVSASAQEVRWRLRQVVL